jgi:hypothetical protein
MKKATPTYSNYHPVTINLVRIDKKIHQNYIKITITKKN